MSNESNASSDNFDQISSDEKTSNVSLRRSTEQKPAPPHKVVIYRSVGSVTWSRANVSTPSLIEKHPSATTEEEKRREEEQGETRTPDFNG